MHRRSNGTREQLADLNINRILHGMQRPLPNYTQMHAQRSVDSSMANRCEAYKDLHHSFHFRSRSSQRHLLDCFSSARASQSVIAHFSGPSHQDRVLSEEASAGLGFSARDEAFHLIKGLFGFKSHRYKDLTFNAAQRRQSALKRPTVATVGMVQDEQSALRMVLSFLLMAMMAIIRWWLCLTPVLVRSLFDTVHSCPHAHPYPYPEELEQERRLLEEVEGVVENEDAGQSTMVAGGVTTQTPNFFDGDEKKRLKARDEAQQYGGSSGPASEPLAGEGKTDETASEDAANPSPRRFKFFERVCTMHRQRHEQGRQMLAATVKEVKKKRLSWRARRAMKKEEQRRQRVIKASQDIGRYSLLYQVGSFLMDQWKQTVLAPGKIQPDAYED
ncbi:hypothetical protein BGZ72_010445 [Mortierella alpina]|nr:hypothetical protein BGZ72_010445 [Mortierella alpina]